MEPQIYLSIFLSSFAVIVSVIALLISWKSRKANKRARLREDVLSPAREGGYRSVVFWYNPSGKPLKDVSILKR